MSDEENQSEVEELSKQVEQLRQRVAELEDTVEQDNGSQSSLLDRYDRYVVDNVDDVHSANPRRLMHLYKQSGIVDRQKRKQRCKRLPQVLEQD